MIRVYYLNIKDYSGLTDAFFKGGFPENSWKRIGGFRNERVRRTKILGEGVVRSILFKETGRSPENYSIAFGSHGKPYVVGLDFFHFNISHSGDYVVCAVSDSEIGIDIERIGNARMEVAGRFFHPGEINVLESLSEVRQNDAFFSYWSVKEAFLKYTGAGLSVPLSTFEVVFECNGIFVRQPEGTVRVSVRPCPVDEGYKCYVCSAADEQTEVCRWEVGDFEFPRIL